MSDKKCDNFGDFFIYRLENILTKSASSDQHKSLIRKTLKSNEDLIKQEFNFYLDAKVKSKEEPKRRGVSGFLLEAWRPIMMYLFMFIIGQYYIINPIIEFFWPVIKLKELPEAMWTLLTVAVGGYIASRGAEKGIQIWKSNSQQQVIVPGEYPMGPGPGMNNFDQPDGFGQQNNGMGPDMFADNSNGGNPSNQDPVNPEAPSGLQDGEKEEDLV